jgi:lipoate-protein ligase A
MATFPARGLRVLVEPGLDGAAHMRRDAELLALQAADAGPTLRLYSWSPPAVSLGHMQEPAALLDLEACRAAGVDVVRRPTGGRAILHWEEITYAVIASVGDRSFGRDLAGAHAAIGASLAAGLGYLGVHAELSRPALDPERRLLRQPCFVSPGRAELLVGGRKLLGSAQRRTAHAFLQHGSLLVGPAHEHLVELLADTRRDPELAASMRARLRRDTVTLRELVGADPPFAALVEALVRGFATTLGLAPVRVAAPAPLPAPSSS